MDLDDDDIEDSNGSKFIDETQFPSLDELGVFLSELGNRKSKKYRKQIEKLKFFISVIL